MQNNGLKVLGVIALVLIIVGFGTFYVWDNNEQAKEISAFQQKDKAENEKLHKRAEMISTYLEDVQKQIEKDINGFVFLGDDYIASRNNLSLETYLSNDLDKNFFYDLNLETYTSASLEKYKLSVSFENHATQNEDYLTILTRLGIKPIIIAKDFTIPEKSESTAVSFKTEGDKKINYSVQETEKLGLTTISGVTGSIKFSTKDSDDTKYYFIRTNQGKEVKIKAGTKVHVESMDYPKNLIPVVFFGNNDYSSVNEYIKTQKAIVDRQSECGGKYIVIAATEKDSDLDKAMLKQFKDNYIRVDKKDTAEMDYEELSDTIYNKMKKLGYFDNIEKKISEAKDKIKTYDGN